jgi:hypothetical protein
VAWNVVAGLGVVRPDVGLCVRLRMPIRERAMEFFVNACVIATTAFAFAYLCFVIVKPERF